MPISFVSVQLHDVLQLFASSPPPPFLCITSCQQSQNNDLPIIVQMKSDWNGKGTQSDPAWQGSFLNKASYHFAHIDKLKRFYKNTSF